MPSSTLTAFYVESAIGRFVHIVVAEIMGLVFSL